MANDRYGPVSVLNPSTDRVKRVRIASWRFESRQPGGLGLTLTSERNEQMTYVPWIVIAAVLVAIGIGTRIVGGGNPNFKLSWGPEESWRSS